jgi:hypothetical protein
MATPGKKPDKAAAMERYIAEIDRFATMLRGQQEEIEQLAKDAAVKKDLYESAKEAVREAKDYEHSTVSLLLKFIRPGSIDVMPLFDTMEPADEEKHGEKSSEWRKEPITSLNLSAAAMRALIGIDIVLVGQLQDLVLKGSEWAKDLEEINDGMAQAIEAKLHQFIEERTGAK